MLYFFSEAPRYAYRCFHDSNVKRHALFILNPDIQFKLTSRKVSSGVSEKGDLKVLPRMLTVLPYLFTILRHALATSLRNRARWDNLTL